MRLAPASYRLALILAVAALLPMAPSLLLQYPMEELGSRLLKMIFSF